MTKRKALDDDDIGEGKAVKKRHKPNDDDDFMFKLFHSGSKLDLNQELETILQLCSTIETQADKRWIKMVRKAKDKAKDGTTKQYCILNALLQLKSYRDKHNVKAPDLAELERLIDCYMKGKSIEPRLLVTNATPSEKMVRTTETLVFRVREYYLHA
jgi:hypothetical protein